MDNLLPFMQGRMLEHMTKQMSGLDNWLVTKTEADYMEHFAGQRDQLVYLTADSPTELQEVRLPLLSGSNRSTLGWFNSNL